MPEPPTVGVPFRLTATKDGVSATLRDKDLPEFLESLSFFDVDFPDWRCGVSTPRPTPHRDWQ